MTIGMFRVFVRIGITILLLSSPAMGQSLDGAPLMPGKDADVDLYLGNWAESMPRHSHGCLIERDILTKGDPLSPPRKGAVLRYVNRFVHATLLARNVTAPTSLKGEQEVFYILGGTGMVRTKGKTADLFAGIGFIVPEGCEFTITNTGDEPLTMYLIVEPVPAGFKPRTEIEVTNNNTMAPDSVIGHWAHVERDVIGRKDGLATITAVVTISLDPMTIGHPHFHENGCEEVWTTISGENIVFLGKQIRRQPVGTAYMIPPDGRTNHGNINQSSNETVKLLYFSVRNDMKK